MYTHTRDDPIFGMVTTSGAEVSEAWGGTGIAGPFDDGSALSFPHWMVSAPFGDCGIAWLEREGERTSELRISCIAAVNVPVSDALFRFVATEARESSWANMHLRWNEENEVAALVVTTAVWSGMFYGMADNRLLDAALFNAMMPVFAWGKIWGEQVRERFGGNSWHWDGSDLERGFMRVVGIGLI